MSGVWGGVGWGTEFSPLSLPLPFMLLLLPLSGWKWEGDEERRRRRKEEECPQKEVSSWGGGKDWWRVAAASLLIPASLAAVVVEDRQWREMHLPFSFSLSPRRPPTPTPCTMPSEDATLLQPWNAKRATMLLLRVPRPVPGRLAVWRREARAGYFH